ncbi:hypothetical protein BV25DRAFT_1831870 [Artomyces pyxidatus]|uniref:Uncharacterized protein n=1 Tax=Artomyces pyxidatus TaxID=48021 RepID=A0ACB8SLX3_9AGAM|nr:hypothetical protein BV25DRAFT_1831870 [Artomyces pyxidatus]
MADPSTAHISRVPNEILHNILSLTHDPDPLFLAPNSDFCIFALVNKRWQGVAQRELFTDVRLGYENREDAAAGIQQFHDALVANPALASLVRSIHYGSTKLAEEEIQWLAFSMTLCDNLIRFEARGWSLRNEPLLDALAAAKKLEIVELSQIGLDGVVGDALCGVSRFLDILQCWKSIRRVSLDINTIHHDLDDPDRKYPPAAHNACPLLRSIEFDPSSMFDADIIDLSHIAPSIAEFRSISCEPDAPAPRRSMPAAFKTWSASLRLVSFGDEFSASQPLTELDSSIVAVLQSSPHLHTLAISSADVAPNFLAKGFPELVALKYNLWARELRDLADALREPGSLPSLRTLTVQTRGSEVLNKAFKKRLVPLGDECRTRSIKLVVPGMRL